MLPASITHHQRSRVAPRTGWLAAILFCLVPACSGETLQPELSVSVALSPREMTIEGVGTQATLQATAVTQAGDPVPATALAWKSLRPEVAVVNAMGVVTTVGLGTALVTASVRGASDTTILRVTASDVIPGVTSVVVSPPVATVEGIGQSLALSATARSANGDIVANPALTWTSLSAAIATVSSVGIVNSVAPGTAMIVVGFEGAADTAAIQVIAPTSPSSGSITVTPSEATLQGIGNAISLQATGRTHGGSAITSSSFVWTSLEPAVATVNSSGLVTSVGVGTTRITVAFQDLADTATVQVTAGAPPTPPPSGETWSRVLSNITIQGDIVVPAGEKWLIGPGVQIAGNLRTVGGTIAMRPGSSLRFIGANPAEYVGGGMTYGPEFARDIGLWVGGSGVLDIRGTPKVGWNRTGVDPSWQPDDEYWITPTEVGDFSPRRWYPGNPIPQADPRVPAAEVLNVTRDILIEGPGHIHINSTKPQRIEYVQLRHLGVSNAESKGPVLGRYALHLHFAIDGSRGTMIRGVAAVESRGTVFVPHVSHGITMLDNVSVNSYGEGLFWDDGDRTNDLVIDRLAVSGVHMPREVSGATSFRSAIENRGGDRMTITNSVSSGARGSKLSHGFDWPERAEDQGAASWNFSHNVAHNNEGAGVRFWFNRNSTHLTEESISYRNKVAGIETGAYRNAISYRDMLLVDNGIFHHSSSTEGVNNDGRGSFYDRVSVYASEGPAIRTGLMRLPPEARIEWVDCILQPGPGAPKVDIEAALNPVSILFRRCGLVPDDIRFPSILPADMENSSVLIEHEDGRKWEITIQNRTKVVRQTN